jgi:putative phage-type endonuclease
MNIRTAKELGDFTPGSDEWLELRKRGITGTDVGSILGVNPFESAYTLWHKKQGLISSHVEKNDRMLLGTLLEAPLLDMFATRNPEYELQIVGTYAHEDYPYLIGNPDALAWKDGKLYIVEVKTSRNYWDEIPPHYIAQTLHYADIFSADGIIFVALTAGDYHEFEVAADKDMFEAQRDAVRVFYETLEGNTPPDWDGSTSTYESVRSRKGNIVAEEFDLGDLGIALSNKNEEFNRVESELKELKSQALSEMGSAKIGIVEGDGVSYKVAEQKQRAGGLPYLQIMKGKK